MAKQIFINLAVTDLQRSLDFYLALGFSTILSFRMTLETAWSGATASL